MNNYLNKIIHLESPTTNLPPYQTTQPTFQVAKQSRLLSLLRRRAVEMAVDGFKVDDDDDEGV